MLNFNTKLVHMKAKKFFLTLIALFVIGDMCSAQTLLSGQSLNRRDRTDAPARIRKSAPAAKAASADAANSTTYFVVSSAYDEYGTFHPEADARNYSGYALKVDMPAGGVSGDVTVTGIYNFGQYEDVTLYPVAGKYDAQAKTITIPTTFSQTDRNKCVKVGQYKRGDYSFTGVIAACSVSKQPDMSGQYPITTLDELVFDVAADGTLTPRTSWLIYSFGGLQNGIENLINSTVGKPISDEANILAVPAAVQFPAETVYAGTKATECLYIVNTGRKAATCQYAIDGSGLELAANPSVDELSFNTFYVYLTAASEGAYSGSIKIKNNDQIIEVPVTADVLKANDYNSIVKNGTFTFSLPQNDYTTYEPWIINEDITGHPVALASCASDSSCGLNIEMNVPEGKIGIFSWKGITETMMPNGFKVMIDDSETLYDNTYAWEGYNAAHPADGYVVVPEGKHTLTFEYMHLMDWYGMGLADSPQRSYIWDLDLQTYDQKDEFGILMDQTVDFGTWYLDKYISGATAEASILNLGDKDLVVTGGEDSESFKVVGIGRKVYSMETLEALISFTGNRIGDYDETVTVKTNGGDFKVRCVAKAEKIVKDYHYLVSEGEFSFGTSISHPFSTDEKNGTAFSSTAKLNSPNDPDPDSWLTASFEVPEGNEGTIYWEASNSSNDYMSWIDDLVFTDGTQVFVDGEQIAEFVGVCDASSTEVPGEYLTLSAGKHVVKFNYVRKSSSSEGNDDRVVIKKIGLKVKKSGIESAVADRIPVNEIFHTIDGVRISNPGNGIFIKTTTFSDGSVETEKVVIR